MNGFEDELRSVLNRYSQENGSDTPDFILAKYLNDCLTTWNHAVSAREKWYRRTRGIKAGSADDPIQKAL